MFNPRELKVFIVAQTPKNVFFDANILIGVGKADAPIFRRVIDLVDGDLINVITTDLTILEVTKKHINEDYDAVKELGRPHFRKLAGEVLGTSLPSVTKNDIRAVLTKKQKAQTQKLFSELAPKILSVDTIKPLVVFTAKIEETGFFSGEGKKDQFADAFIFECLRVEAAKEPIIIVSNDADFIAPCKAEPNFKHVASIADLFVMLGLKIEQADLDAFFGTKHDELVELMDAEINDWGLEASDVEDAYIDSATVTNIEIVDYTSFSSASGGDDILVIGVAHIVADVSYTHPDWDNAMYDSEDKVLIPFDTVEGETEVEFDVDFSLSIEVDDKGEPSTVTEVSFRNASFKWITLHPADEYR